MKYILTSRKFWVALFTLFVVIVAAFMPGFDLDIETAAGLAVIVSAYMVGVAIDPGPGGWAGVLKSRKFWTAFISLAVLLLDAFNVVIPFDLTIEQMVLFVTTVAGFIIGVAAEKPKGISVQPMLHSELVELQE